MVMPINEREYKLLTAHDDVMSQVRQAKGKSVNLPQSKRVLLGNIYKQITGKKPSGCSSCQQRYLRQLSQWYYIYQEKNNQQ